MKRRDFLKGTATTVALAAAGSSRAGGSAANRVRLGLIGCGGRGRFVAGHARRVPDAEIVAVCDLFPPNRESAREWIGGQCRSYADFRELLDQPDIDAVIIATPDHWHAIPTVLACQAGKDVYVEKPLGHNIREGQAMVQAARRHERIVQTGTQQRSAAHFETMREIIQSGQLGPVHFVRIWNYRNIHPRGITSRAPAQLPEELDWNFYLGPAPRVPYDPNRFLQNFRWFWDYAGGIITDWGIHRFDSMHQVMGVDAPRTVSAAGARFELNDGAEVPDMMQATFEYPGFVMSYEACALNAHGMGGRTPGRAYYRASGTLDRPNGLAFYGTNGTLMADRLGFEVYPELKLGSPGNRGRSNQPLPADALRMEPREGSSGDSTYLHVANFVDSVRTRKTPAADVLVGHRSTTVAHLGNIAFKTGRKITWDAEREEIIDDPEATQLMGRNARKPWDLI